MHRDSLSSADRPWSETEDRLRAFIQQAPRNANRLSFGVLALLNFSASTAASCLRTRTAFAKVHSTQYASEKKPTCLLIGSISRRSPMICLITSGKKLCHQYPARLKLGNSRASVQRD